MATRDTGAVGGHITRRLVQIADGALGNAKKTIQGIETMNIIQKEAGQIKPLRGILPVNSMKKSGAVAAASTINRLSFFPNYSNRKTAFRFIHLDQRMILKAQRFGNKATQI
jgi:hypothetical protein